MPTQDVTPQPLSDAELERLCDVLERFGDKRAMNAEELDGFLAAVICGPDYVPQSECLRVIWGDDIVNEDAFSTRPLLKDFVSLITRHRDVISHTLQSGDVFMPLLLEEEHGIYRANDWATGFMRGMEFHRSQWASLLEDEEHGGSLVPILALAHEHHPDSEMRPYKEPISPELRETLIVGSAAGVMRIYRYFQARRLMVTHTIGDSTTHRRITAKVGRNEPCPCGSGKKFKQCCGKITRH
jgi:uncharacterized protein